MREKSPVRNIAGVKEDLACGGAIEVECVESATKVTGVWGGVWQLYVLTRERDGEEHRALIVTGRNLTAKVFRTVEGLVSLAHELGFLRAEIPLVQGEIAVWQRDGAQSGVGNARRFGRASRK